MSIRRSICILLVMAGAPAAALAQPCGTPWTQSPWQGPTPSARDEFALGYDSSRTTVLLFGGHLKTDTWEWSGAPGSWALRAQAGPAPRTQPSMAYDQARAKTVMFGGRGSGSQGSETWEWDGAAGTWTPRIVAGPSARWAPAMAYDPVRARVVLFGGGQSVPQSLSDTWEWNGASWTLVSPSATHHSPLGMVFDPVRARCVLVATKSDGEELHRGVFEWDGAQWVERALGGLPDGLAGAVVYDPVRARTVLIGNVYTAAPFPSPAVLREVWEWDSGPGTWSLRTSSGPPPSRIAWLPAAFDGSQIMMFGISPSPSVAGSQTWLYHGDVSAGPTLSHVPWEGPKTVQAGESIALHAAAVGAATYQWRRFGQPLVDGGSITGSSTPTLTINPTSPGTTGYYDVIVTDVCGPTTRTPVAISVPCYANCDGSVTSPILNINDFQCFLNYHAMATTYANCDGSTAPPILNANDFQCFLNQYAAGCP